MGWILGLGELHFAQEKWLCKSLPSQRSKFLQLFMGRAEPMATAKCITYVR